MNSRSLHKKGGSKSVYVKVSQCTCTQFLHTAANRGCQIGARFPTQSGNSIRSAAAANRHMDDSIQSHQRLYLQHKASPTRGGAEPLARDSSFIRADALTLGGDRCPAHYFDFIITFLLRTSLKRRPVQIACIRADPSFVDA